MEYTLRVPLLDRGPQGAAGAAISLFSAGYFRASEGTAPGLLCLQYHVFLASMAFVILADDAYLFMVAWETMALSSYFQALLPFSIVSRSSPRRRSSSRGAHGRSRCSATSGTGCC